MFVTGLSYQDMEGMVPDSRLGEKAGEPMTAVQDCVSAFVSRTTVWHAWIFETLVQFPIPSGPQIDGFLMTSQSGLLFDKSSFIATSIIIQLFSRVE